jgi:16S rRNA C1402 (ribose-2'-O) methylase RsmI
MTNNKAREVNNPIIKQLLDETTAEELAKIDTTMTNNKQQTAVEWLAENTPLGESIFFVHKIEQAKAMEREQIKDAHERGQSDEKDYWNIGDKVGVRFMVKSEEYYEQTYGGGEQ